MLIDERQQAAMATLPLDEEVIAPRPGENRVDELGTRSANEIAREICEDHYRRLDERREPLLLAEKYLLHVDGSGDLQWADVLDGTRVDIPALVAEYRKSENLLRPIVDNAVAHHTTQPFRFHAESSSDRKARDRATIDTLWANHLSVEQRLKSLFADALYLAMPAGFCPVHAYWRDDVSHAWFESINPPSDAEHVATLIGEDPQPGMVDCWLGNPWSTVYDPGAKRRNIRWMSYDRVLYADDVRRFFDHVPGVSGLEGTSRLPSAAEFQRIAQSWNIPGLTRHGSPIHRESRGKRGDGDELMVIICREIAPGVTQEYEEGRLQIIAVPGEVDPRKGRGNAGHAVLLYDKPLPGKTFSATNFYSHHRGSDVHGKPWIEALDEHQVHLNIALSKRWEYLQRNAEAPIVTPGGAIHEDLVELDGYSLMEVEPSMANWRPRAIEWPPWILQGYNQEIEDRRKAMYTIGGYQAASRGEAPGSRMAYRAILALQQADSQVHGPVNTRFRESACDFLQSAWKQMKYYGDVPWLVSVVGDEFAHLVEPYISTKDLSPHPPKYKMVNAFGASPEVRAQEVLDLVTLRGADGVPFLRTDEARAAYPHSTIFDDDVNPGAVARRRARAVVQGLVQFTHEFREQAQAESYDIWDEQVQQGAQWVFQMAESYYPRFRDDDIEASIATLTEIVQDETVDPITRLAARERQNLYYQVQEQMMAAMAQQEGEPAGPAGGPAGGGGEVMGTGQARTLTEIDQDRRQMVAGDM